MLRYGNDKEKMCVGARDKPSAHSSKKIYYHFHLLC